jgi:hypothetical protein
LKDEFDFNPLKEYLKREPGILELGITMLLKVPFYIIKYGMVSRMLTFFDK